MVIKRGVLANEVKQSHEIAASLRSSQGLLSDAVPYNSVKILK